MRIEIEIDDRVYKKLKESVSKGTFASIDKGVEFAVWLMYGLASDCPVPIEKKWIKKEWLPLDKDKFIKAGTNFIKSGYYKYTEKVLKEWVKEK